MGGAFSRILHQYKNTKILFLPTLPLLNKKHAESYTDIASHAGVFWGARISSLPTREEIRAPLKTPAWEANTDTKPKISFIPTLPLLIKKNHRDYVK